MSTTLILSFDPGASGGLAYGQAGATPVVEPMPDTLHDLVERVVNLLVHYPSVVAYVEEVGGFIGKGQPGSAMFKFGQGYGQILGILAAHQIPITLVRPQKWQKALGLGTSAGGSKTDWKNKLKVRAQQLFPTLSITLKTADALLIWHAATKNLI